MHKLCQNVNKNCTSWQKTFTSGVQACKYLTCKVGNGLYRIVRLLELLSFAHAIFPRLSTSCTRVWARCVQACTPHSLMLHIYLSPLRFSISSTAPGPLGPSISSTMHPCCGLHHVTDFLAFLRAGEFTCPSLRVYTPCMLSPMDVTVDTRDSPSMVSIHLRQSENDPFGECVTIHFGITGEVICPVTAILAYMARRGVAPGALFLFQDGSPLSKQRLVQCLLQALAPHGLDSPLLTGHSFRIGAATTAAQVGLQDFIIQIPGRWHSSAYQRYIRTPSQVLAAMSRQLLGTGHVTLADLSVYLWPYILLYICVMSLVPITSSMLYHIPFMFLIVSPSFGLSFNVCWSS